MKDYILKRLGFMLFTLIGASILIFFLVRVIPGDPIRSMLASAQVSDPELVAEYRQRYGLDKPIYVQYIRWVFQMLRGKMGESIIDGTPVISVLIPRLKATLILAFASTVVAVFSGAVVGTLGAFITARKGNKFLDNLFRLGPMVFLTFPPFSLGLFLIIIFSVKVTLFPATGMSSITGEGGILSLLHHLILPALTMGAASAGATARITRSSVLEVIQKDYIRAAYAKGLPDTLVKFRHALRNALIPLVTNTGIMFGQLLSNAVLVEEVFAWPGLGRMLVRSILARNFPLIQGGVIIIALIYIIVNFLVDLSYCIINPKIVYEGKGD